MNLDLSKDTRDFLKDLQPKQCKQVLMKIIDLQRDAYPADAKHLSGIPGYRRVDCGEFRVCYTVKSEIVYVTLVDKRNDDEVYKKLSRKV